jgi:histone deacetylase 11
LRKRLGRAALHNMWLEPDRAVSRDELLEIHTADYLRKLRSPAYVAAALEVPFAARLPRWMLDWFVLRPMRWATRGTVIAAQAAFEHGLAINLSGGYHHAKPDEGEGFCVYSDAALAVHTLRSGGMLGPEDRVAHIDLDVHQGNGVCYQFMNDRRVLIFDMYNQAIYPMDFPARMRLDADIPLATGCGDDEYLLALQRKLPEFLETLADSGAVRLAIYNAGTDVVAGDPLGQLNLSPGAVLERDLFVVDQFRRRNIPTLMLPSGGYTRQSYRLVADSVERLLRSY